MRKPGVNKKLNLDFVQEFTMDNGFTRNFYP